MKATWKVMAATSAVSLFSLSTLAMGFRPAAARHSAVIHKIGVARRPALTHKIGGTLNLLGGPNGTWVDENNPFAPGASNTPATYIVYEPLIQWNSANGHYKPWLATSWSWNKAATVLTVDLRPGVHFSNGMPFTSKDVAFTFHMLKKYPATDVTGLWTYLKSVSMAGSHAVKFVLKKPNAMFFYYMAQVPIVPASIWSHHNPVTWTDPHPIGTGPFEFHSFSPELVTLTRNPHYWQAPKPYLKTLRIPAEQSNTTTVLALAENKLQWSGTFSFNLRRSYVNRDPKYNHVGLYPNGLDVLYVNLHHYPLNLLVVRRAISMALNRRQITNIGFSGYSPPVTNLTGITPGMAKTWSTPTLNRKFSARYAPVLAKRMLLKAGFKAGPNGVLKTPKGKPFNVSIDVSTPYTDFVAASEQITQQLKRIGINVTIQSNSANTYYHKLQLGQFDLAVCWAPWGANPFFTLYPFMSKQFSKPMGQYATANFERYYNPRVESLGAQFLATNVHSKQVLLVHQLASIFATQLPVIPLTYRNTPIEYSTKNIGGWPTPANPYWNVNEGNLPVLTNLYYK